MPADSIIVENLRPGTAEWRLKRPATAREIEGYASATSVDRSSADGIAFFVSTAVGEPYRCDVYRMGWYGGAGARLHKSVERLVGFTQQMPARDPHFGTFDCDWAVSFTLTSADFATWVSGVYLVKLTGSSTGKESYCIFVLRDDDSDADFVFQSSVTNFQAYNDWPGAPDGMSIYAPGGTEETGAAALKVSFNRPYGITRLGSAYALGATVNPNSVHGAGAGEFLTNLSSDRFTMAGGWEYNLVRFLEREGYDVTYSTSIDTHRRGADALLRHRAFVSVGHDEYWTWEMRDAVEGARDRGLNLVFLSANTCYWQARLEPSANSRAENDRVLVVYKNDIAPERVDFITGEGDLFDPADHRTVLWASVPRPDAALTGVSVFAAPTAGPDAFYSADFVVADPASFAFAGTGLGAGDAIRGIVGMECDSLQPTSPIGSTVFARSPVTTGAPSDAVAYTTAAGSTVVTVDSMQWSWGLDDLDVSATRPAFSSDTARLITRNILRRALSSGNQLDSLQTYDILPAELDANRWEFGAICEGPPSDAFIVDPPGPTGVVLHPAPDTPGFGGLVSTSVWDLRGKQVRVLVADSGGALMDTFVTLTGDHDNWRRVIREGGLLYFQANDDGARTWIAIDYDPAQHAWWRIRHDEAGASMVYETSADGVSWEYQHELLAPAWLSAARVELQAGTLGSVPDPGSARFVSFAVEPSDHQDVPTGFTDTFIGFARDENRWRIGTSSAGAGESAADLAQGDGVLVIRLPARSTRPLTSDPTTFVGGANYSGYVTVEAWNLARLATSIEVITACAGADASTIFGISVDESNWIRFRQSGADLVLESAYRGAVSAEQVEYSPQSHRHWRLSHVPGEVRFETAPPGATDWTVLHAVPQPNWIVCACIEIQAGTETPDGAIPPAEAIFGAITSQKRVFTAEAP